MFYQLKTYTLAIKVLRFVRNEMFCSFYFQNVSYQIIFIGQFGTNFYILDKCCPIYKNDFLLK